jgi:mRNA interferase MazF
MMARKWDVAWAELDPARGHEQAGRRPVLVFCNDVIASPIGLATVLPLTAWRRGRRVYPTEVLLPKGEAGLGQASLVMGHQIRTLALDRLTEAEGSLEDEGLRASVTKAVLLWLDCAATV